MKRNKLSKVFTIAALSLVVGGSSAFAANTAAWTSGAAKWYNNTNFKLSSILGSVSKYFATDTYVEKVNGLYPALTLKSETAEPNSVNSSSEKTIHLHPNWAVYYKDDNELADAADLVVQGIVKEDLGSNIDNKGAYYSYYTDVSLEVTKVIKGDPAENQKVIRVSQMGGSDGSVNVVSEGSTKLLKDQEVTLFLKRLNDERYIPINEDESIFVNAGGEFLNTANGGSLSIE